MRENNAADVRIRLYQVLNNKRFQRNLANAKNNWLGANIDKVISGILRYFEWEKGKAKNPQVSKSVSNLTHNPR